MRIRRFWVRLLCRRGVDRKGRLMFQGKRVWITGASSGIGAGLARAFGAAGAVVLLSGRFN